MQIPTKDQSILRDLAKQVAEIAADPIHKARAEMWTRHNDLERVKPMVLAFPEGSWRELLPRDQMQCESEQGRNLEYGFRMKLYTWRNMPDDNVIDDIFYTPTVTHCTGWGLEPERTPSDMQLGAWHIKPVLLEDADADKLQIPEITVDWQETERIFDANNALFGDILTVKRVGRQRGGICPLDRYSQLRGIDMMFMDLVDKPELVHKVVGTLVDGEIAMLKSLEEQNALSLGNTNTYAGSGGTSYTRELPQEDFDGTHVRLKDLWGFATAQIFSEVSPGMHEEFALQHESRYLDLFGLNCYGCCEPLHLKLDSLFRMVPRLRRISISPWADVELSSEKLADNCIFSWKPNPAMLAGETWEPDAIRREMRQFCERTQNNIVEIIMKDTHTVRNDPRRFHDWVRITREIAEDFAS